MTIEFKLPQKPVIKRHHADDTPSPGGGSSGEGTHPENFPEQLPGRRRNRGRPDLTRVSDKPPHTKFAVIPSRAITDPRINTRKPLLLLLCALGIHASVWGICYPSQRRLAALCGKSPSWANKYLSELRRLGYVRRLVPPRQRGPRSAQRLQILWQGNDPLPSRETDWNSAPWCWR
jgi:Helix-turn-helix domain